MGSEDGRRGEGNASRCEESGIEEDCCEVKAVKKPQKTAAIQKDRDGWNIGPSRSYRAGRSETSL
jgi:hypothetical protein